LLKRNDECVTGKDKRGGRKKTAVHNRLAVLRAERGVSRAELAAAVGVNPQTIGFLERGDYGPSAELGLKICEFFGLPFEAVFSLRPFAPMSSQLYRSADQDPGGQP
jgi:DNA-binding XRE family transcriptional regulator